MRRVTVITADIIGSRNTPDFIKAKNVLNRQLAEIKHSGIITPFSISRGDEIQALLDGWIKAPEIIRILRYFCRPLNIRVGLGIGFLEEEILEETTSWSMNGVPFHLARAAVDEAHEIKGCATVLKTGQNELDKLSNSIWLLIDAIQNSWTDKQWEAVHVYEQIGTYEGASKHLGISMQAVQKRCKSAHWGAVKQAENSLKVLENLLLYVNYKV